MKNFIPVLFLLGLFLAACGGSGNNSDAKAAARESIQEKAANPAPLPSTTLPASGGATVQHYTCPNNCEGSGGPSQANCPVCGTAYVHNQAYHNQPSANPSTPPVPPTPGTTPGTNAAGVYHYICSNGCEGGSGSQGNCSSCGNALVHNAAYHNS